MKATTAPRSVVAGGPYTFTPGMAASPSSACRVSARPCSATRSIPSFSRYSIAAVSPTASAIEGVPGSNRHGRSFH